MSVEQNKQIVRDLFATMDRDSSTAIDTYAGPSFTAEVVGMPGPMDREGMRGFAAGFYQAFAGLTHTIEDIVAEGDAVVVRLSIRGRHQGELMGVPPSGKDAAFGSITWLRLADGKVAEMRIQADMMSMMQQIGAIPAPA